MGNPVPFFFFYRYQGLWLSGLWGCVVLSIVSIVSGKARVPLKNVELGHALLFAQELFFCLTRFCFWEIEKLHCARRKYILVL